MAGIGWKLERMLERGSLTSTLQAYLTGAAITSAPWLLTTAVLVTLRVMARGQMALEFTRVEQLITVAYAVTLVLSAPIHVVVSRYAADRLYEEKLDLVGGPLRDSLSYTLLGFLGVGIVTMAILAPPIEIAVPGAALIAVIAAQWLLLSVGGGMSSPTRVLRAFAIGAVISIVAALGLERVAGLGARGYLLGFTLGQAVALAGMLIVILRSLPEEESQAPRNALPRAFREYRLLAFSALAVYAAVWIDKVATFTLSGGAAATVLANAATLAWFTLLPAFAWIYLQVETRFFRAFRSYFRGITSGASLDQVEANARVVRTEAARLVSGAAAVQATMMGFGMLAAPHIVAALGMPPEVTLSLRLSLIAASLQLLTLLGLLLLYYLDLRREAFVVAITQLAAAGIATVVAIGFGAPPALGAAIGSAMPAARALVAVRRSVIGLVRDTFQSQPYGVTPVSDPDEARNG